MQSKQVNSALLVLAAFIWGTAFVAQSRGAEYLPACTYTAIRSFIGGTFLLLLSLISDAVRRSKAEAIPQSDRKLLLIGGVCCGAVLAAASVVQQVGIGESSVGKAGFITTMYIILVPIFGIFLKRRTGVMTWVSAAIAVVGLYLLCVKEHFTVGRGDIFLLLCAVFFSCHILVIDRFSPRLDPIKLSCVQFFVCGILLTIPAAIMDPKPAAVDLRAALGSLLYAGVLSSGVAFTLQIVAQKKLNPTVASLIMCLESVFSVLAGWVILHQKLSARELCGCALVFGAVILTQVAGNRTTAKTEKGSESNGNE